MLLSTVLYETLQVRNYFNFVEIASSLWGWGQQLYSEDEIQCNEISMHKIAREYEILGERS